MRSIPSTVSATFQDELFIRSPRGMQPTQAALNEFT
jgi:hypothetical protein